MTAQAPNSTQPHWDHGLRGRLARGEESALAELYDLYAPLVHALAHRFLADEKDAGHVMTEVFAELWQAPEAYAPERGPLRPWLRELTHRHAVRRLREHARTDTRAESRARAGERLRAAEAAVRADRAVTALPAGLRTVLELAYVRHRDYRQAAAELGMSEAEARRRLRLGLRLLSAAAGPGAGSAP
ncbi:sigma-70 family RNA polymerase sigma factor [Streptomyces sp. TRM 70361]|uniref:sigma-70 family RNA polymerase sigma factor n=1 Tax=Streptomyces sp. TRM 70361 TaxID=3116553 RepID=UPI002E7B6D61|nr:sigma-70 family RNA polymerase sigma factor [Streptomyces sp. TRM 70361]MEE1938363.1 sigma-70 family RNA polymerase sigma factor [Streptomyces sp. TRM 70361]